MIDGLQVILFLVILTLLTPPLGIYLSKVLDPSQKTFLDMLLKPLERVTYTLLRVDPMKEQNWKEYLYSVLAFSLVAFLLTAALLILQPYLPLNPESLGSLSLDLNFNTSLSFMTNTNWQSYGGESTMSYFSQMVALTVQNFVSPAVGLGVSAALVRGIVRHTSETIGNFWTDLVRITYYLLLPLALVAAIFYVSQGVPQNFSTYTAAETIESNEVQTIVQGPIASQEAIKILGTNGGGYTNVNSAHPYENPTPLSNFVQIILILLIPAAQTYYLGRETKHQKHGWAIYTVMAFAFIVGWMVCHSYEKQGNPHFASLNIDTSQGNMEGKEVRFGVLGSTLFTTATTTASNGAVNSMLDSYTPVGGLVPLLNMQLGEVIWGGVGAGLYSVLIFVILSVFIAGLIIGRTPEYLGKKIAPFDIKVSIFALLAFIFVVLSFTAWACVSSWGILHIGNQGPHGFSEILYAYSSATANNGSAFAGLSANNPMWNITLGCAMLFGRFCVIAPVMALAGSLARKKHHPASVSSFPVEGTTFIILLVGVILLVGALCFLPALVMGPLMEQFLMYAMRVF